MSDDCIYTVKYWGIDEDTDTHSKAVIIGPCDAELSDIAKKAEKVLGNGTIFSITRQSAFVIRL